MSSRISHYIVRQMFTDVLEEQTASIFKANESVECGKSGTDTGSSLFRTLVLAFCMSLSLGLFLYHEQWGTMFL
jgi:hypothetical protein